ncbi:hypothetical protein Hanom_Chr15g01337761 [Helianthus anomalus]
MTHLDNHSAELDLGCPFPYVPPFETHHGLYVYLSLYHSLCMEHHWNLEPALSSYHLTHSFPACLHLQPILGICYTV